LGDSRSSAALYFGLYAFAPPALPSAKEIYGRTWAVEIGVKSALFSGDFTAVRE
jgi:hypothetical protein